MNRKLLNILTIELNGDEHGRHRHESGEANGVKWEACQWLYELLASDNGVSIESPELSVGQFLEQWLNDHALPNVTPRTYREYQGYVNRYLKPTIGHIPLKKLTSQNVRELYAEIIGKGLSSTTANHAHVILNAALNYAVEQELVPKNVCKIVKAPRRNRAEIQTLNASQAQVFLNNCRNSVYGSLFYLALYTGMRRSELLGLQWRDIDFKNRTLSVRRTLHMVNRKGLVISEPKTNSSRRSISLSSRVIAVLSGLKAKQKDYREVLNLRFKETDLVFSHPNGRNYCPSTVSKVFKQIIRELDLPDIRFHDLRHTHATLMIKNGIHPKVVSERLGHSNINITLDTYSHVLPGMQEEAAQKFEEIIVAAKT